jgi:DNA-binding LytR/AlgR family response regulator
MKVVIVEDEAIAARRMQRLLEERGMEVTQVIESNEELSAYLDKGSLPELFFMDIHLNDGVVLDLLMSRNPQVPIIFTTAYDQYALKAFKLQSIDYLLKPIDEDELDAALAKHKNSQPQVDLTALTNLIKLQANPQSYKDRFSVRVGDKIRSFNIDELHLFYSADKINSLQTEEGRSYPIDYTIEQLSGMVDPKRWYRVNRGYIISISAIIDVVAYSNSRLKVLIHHQGSHEIIVSREKVRDFKEWLG